MKEISSSLVFGLHFMEVCALILIWYQLQTINEALIILGKIIKKREEE